MDASGGVKLHGPACFDPETVTAWFDGCLTEAERVAAERHMEACDECRTLLVALARDRAPRTESPGGATARAPFRVGSHVGRYVITEWLGAGGMGVVYAAYDAALERRVAIKILSCGERDGDSDGSALLREGQAAARVSHPNVVTVHDAGKHDGQLFVAMELVEGATLAEWLASGARGASAILALFSEAARGLAAVHAAGLVHADFKPSNVLVDGKGHALVSDFGLAQVGIDGRPRRHGGCAPLTGTPRYMSPEQCRGDPIDALSDQFSFCLALAEALYGRLLQAGSRPPVRAGVAPRVREALQRGLSLDPLDRFPSMDALADVLVPPQRSPWKPVGIAALVAACASAGVASYEHWRPHAMGPRGCAIEGALDGVWDDARKDTVTKALRAAHAPYANEAASEIARNLDRYADAWLKMRARACDDASSRPARSEDIPGLRLACLDDQARQLGSLVDVLAAGGSDLAQAVDAVEALPPVEACGDSAALRRRAPSPLRVDVRRQVESIRDDLRRGVSLSRTGDYRGASGLEAALLDPARATGYRVIEAEVAFEVGETKLKLGELPLAEDLLREAVEAAEAGNDDVTKARALIALTTTLAERESLLVEARRTGGLASAVLEHLPEQVELRAELDDALAAIDHGEGRYADALASAREGLELRASAYGLGDERVAASLASCGRRALNMGDLARGLDFSRAALATFEGTLGPLHPRLVPVLRAVALGEMALGDLEGAQRDIRRAESVAVDALGADHPSLPDLRGIAANVLLAQHHPGGALDLAIRAEEQAETLRLPSVDLIHLLNTVGLAYLQLARFDDALLVLERSRALCASSSNPAFEAVITEELHARALLEKGRAREAIAPLQRVVAMRESSESAADPDIAEARFLLARALWQGGGNRRNARELADRARAAFAEASRPEDLEEIKKWLSRHRVSSKR